MDLGVSKDKGLLTTDGALFGIHRLISVAWDVEVMLFLERDNAGIKPKTLW